jgi:hypothetical protein
VATWGGVFLKTVAAEKPNQSVGSCIPDFMKKALLTLHLFSLFTFSLSAQAPAIEWQRYLGGSDDDIASSIQQTFDGGYIVAGVTNSNNGDVTGNHGLTDAWVVKFDGSGNLNWQKCMGGSSEDKGYDIQQTSDRGFIMAGHAYSNDGDATADHGMTDLWIVRLDSSGALQWQNCLGGSEAEQAFSVQQTTDGGYIVAGQSWSDNGDVSNNQGAADYWVVRLDSTGSILWRKCWGGSGIDIAHSVVQTSDGGYIVAGYSFSTDGHFSGNIGGWDSWLVKLEGNGYMQWMKCLGGSGSDNISCVQQTSDGGYIVAGSSNSINGGIEGNHGSSDIWVVKLKGSGKREWQKCLGGSSYESATSIQQTSDGGYIVAGFTSSNDGDITGNHGLTDAWVVKLDDSGNLNWQKCLGGTDEDRAHSIQETSDGGYILAGSSESDDGDLTGNHGRSDYWVIKLESLTGIEDAGDVESAITIYPNPAGHTVRLDVTSNSPSTALSVTALALTDLLGRTVIDIKPHAAHTELDVSALPTGLYTVAGTLQNGVSVRQRLVVVR